MTKPKSIVQIHFDGDIASGHQIPIRILGKSLLHMQKAIDRAYLDIKNEGIWKYARMKEDDYEITEFIAQAPMEGGYIFSSFSSINIAPTIIDRVSSAINQAKSQISSRTESLKHMASDLKQKLTAGVIKPIKYKKFARQGIASDKMIKREYGDRSIAKEIDQVISPVRQDYAGDSSIALKLTGKSTQEFEFNRISSTKFHKVVAGRNLAKPILFSGELIEADKSNLKGRFQNSDSGRVSIIHFADIDDFLLASPYLSTDDEMVFIGSPIIEFGSMEPRSGDVFFLNIVK